jgi:hypothetical protein
VSVVGIAARLWRPDVLCNPLPDQSAPDSYQSAHDTQSVFGSVGVPSVDQTGVHHRGGFVLDL